MPRNWILWTIQVTERFLEWFPSFMSEGTNVSILPLVCADLSFFLLPGTGRLSSEFLSFIKLSFQRRMEQSLEEFDSSLMAFLRRSGWPDIPGAFRASGICYDMLHAPRSFLGQNSKPVRTLARCWIDVGELTTRSKRQTNQFFPWNMLQFIVQNLV